MKEQLEFELEKIQDVHKFYILYKLAGSKQVFVGVSEEPTGWFGYTISVDGPTKLSRLQTFKKFQSLKRIAVEESDITLELESVFNYFN